MRFTAQAGVALTLFLAVFLGPGCPPIQGKPVNGAVTELELVSSSFLTPPHGDMFEFSGLEIMPNGTFLLLNDDRGKIYSFSGRISDSVKVAEIADLDICLPDKKQALDLESVRRYQSQTVLLANEAEHQVIEWNLKTEKARIVAAHSSEILGRLGFTSSHGLEALCPFKTDLLLIKETPPVSLVLVTLPEGKFKKVFTLKADTDLIDITDCIYADSTLYLLHRGGWRILLTRQQGDQFLLYEVWDFSRIKAQPRFDYFIPDPVTGRHRNDWGLAEALAMDEQYVYVGMDNNGESLRSNPRERRATLAVFKRPEEKR